MWDVLIAGAGPAGAVAARVLARAGRRVLLIDDSRPDLPKVGESLPGAADLTEFGRADRFGIGFASTLLWKYFALGCRAAGRE